MNREVCAGDVAVPFVCAMSDDTPTAFDCTPHQGFLQPRAPPGAQQPPPPIHVHFTCHDFGKTAQGTVHVYTQEQNYMYRVLGKQPGYAPPAADASPSRLDRSLRAETEAAWAARKVAAAGKSLKRGQLSRKW